MTEQVVELRKKGETIANIAKITRISRGDVREILKQQGLHKRMQDLISQKSSEQIKKSYLEGKRKSTKGRKHTPEALKIMSEKAKARRIDTKTKKKISNTMKEMWQDKKYAKHMSEAHKGQKPSSGCFRKGQVAPRRTKLSSEQTKIIFSMNKKRKSSKDIAKVVGVHHSVVLGFITRNKLKHLTYAENALNNLENGKLKKTNTSIEIKFKNKLLTEGLIEGEDFVQSYLKGNFIFDFYFPKFDLFVECDGDFWHANPKFYDLNNLHKIQQHNVKQDKKKNSFCYRNNLKLLRFWEWDINENVDLCFEKIKKVMRDERSVE